MAVMWGVALLLVVAIPILLVLLKGIVSAARGIDKNVNAIAGVAAAGSQDLDAVVVLLTTQSYIGQIVDGLANYGGSLNAALPDA
jgi:TM2 domain-containing membrane protein YozV